MMRKISVAREEKLRKKKSYKRKVTDRINLRLSLNLRFLRLAQCLLAANCKLSLVAACCTGSLSTQQTQLIRNNRELFAVTKAAVAR